MKKTSEKPVVTGNSGKVGGITKSKKDKNKNPMPKPSGIITDAMKGRIFSSLADLGAALGIKSEEKEIRGKTCRECGGQMHRVEGSNVWLCGNPIKKDGKVVGHCQKRLIVRT